MTDLPEKVKKLISSDDPESRALGMAALREIHPSLWCAFLNYVGYGVITEDVIKHLSNQNFLNVGHQVKYKGFPDAPIMIVTSMGVHKIERSHKTSAGITHAVLDITPGYYTTLQAKYWNKSNQTFMTVEDRIECFEIINKNI